jgi:SpoVK/Ycf46/Vps4 family AAA+-type ATPase
MNGNQADWKQEAFALRKAQKTTVTAIETDDPVRLDQIGIVVKNARYKTKKPEEGASTNGNGEATITFGDLTTGDYVPRRIVVDPWTGAKEYHKTKTGRKEIETLTAIEQPQDQNNPFAALAQNTGAGFTQAIQIVDEAARREPTIALFERITEKQLADALALPIQSWSHSTELLKQKSWIIVHTNDVTQFSPATREAFKPPIQPPVSTEKERQTTIIELLKAMTSEPKPTADPTLIRLTSGLNLHDLESTLLDSFYRTNSLEARFITKTKIDIIKAAGFDIEYPTASWNHMGGYACIRDFYQSNLMATMNDETAQLWNLEPTRGIIEFGRPGTGKSLRARILATEAHLPFIKVDATNLFGGIVGESERKVRTLIRTAEANAPCILFFDELDALLPPRGSVMATDSGVQRRTQNALMDYLGDNKRQSIVIGATNLISQLDQAAIRAGRFDDLIPVLDPDATARREIIRVHSQVWRKIPLALTEADFDRLVHDTVLWSGAEIESLVKKAARRARQANKVHVSLSDFNAAMQEEYINIPKRKQELLALIEEAKTTQHVNKRLLDEQTRTLQDELKDVQDATAYSRTQALRDERQ